MAQQILSRNLILENSGTAEIYLPSRTGIIKKRMIFIGQSVYSSRSMGSCRVGKGLGFLDKVKKDSPLEFCF